MTSSNIRYGSGALAVAFALALGVGCGGSSHTSTTTPPPPPTGANVQAITVNAGPAGNYVNGAFTSVTVCAPVTTSCQTIDGVLVDTGSSGLRLLSSAITTITLPPQKASDGNAVVECLPFVTGLTWGPVATADIQIAGEKASAVPIQILSDSAYSIPTTCKNQGTPQDTLTNLGANGILGVGMFLQVCGSACLTTGASNPGLYYGCTSASSCVVSGEPLAQQVSNPVSLFATDNNGVIVELPAAPAPQATLSGSLIFGIGTRSNNALGSATVYPMDNNFNFTTTYNNQAYSSSFIDSGSNGLYFLTTTIDGIPTCADANSFYCPTSPKTITAVNQGASGIGTGTVTFTVANADTLFNTNPTDTVLGQLAGPTTISGFDWGLPFFYGRNVFTAIEGRSTPGGTGPYWAY